MAKESIEALLSPSLKVSRPVAACQRCRSSKVKCDGKLPACSACERAGKAKECSSANDDFARGKERSYVAALETTIKRLQRKIDDQKTEGSSSRESVAMLANGRPVLYTRPVNNVRRKEAGSVDELVSDFGFLTVNATSRDFQGFSSTMSFAKMMRAVALHKALPSYNDSSLPPRYGTSRLINHYFENVYPLLPFLSETEFMGSVSRVYEDSAADTASPMDIWCFRLILAISSASLCRSRGDDHYHAAVFYVSTALATMELVLYPGSITGIQALLLLTQYALVDPEHFDSWYLVGMAARLVVDLGLHCEPAPETKVSKHALDLRRRVFYCTYALDRLVSMSRGLAFSFTDDSAPNVLLPTLSTDQEARSPSQLFLRSVRPSLFLFDIRRVQSAFYQSVKWSSRKAWSMDAASSYISSSLDDIRAWHSTLPSAFSHKHLQTFNLEFLYSQALALSPNEVVSVTTLSGMHKVMFFQCAVQFSGQLNNMVNNPELQPCLCYADFCRARYVSRQFQDIMWASFDRLIQGDQNAGSPMQTVSPWENCQAALYFLSNMSQILEWPKQRWNIGALKETFEQESAVLLARLKSRQQEYIADDRSATVVGQTNQQLSNTVPNTTTSHQRTGANETPQSDRPTAQEYDPNYGYHTLRNDGPATYFNPVMQHSSLTNASYWHPPADQANPELPPGSLPRRSYQFTGGHG